MAVVRSAMGEMVDFDKLRIQGESMNTQKTPLKTDAVINTKTTTNLTVDKLGGKIINKEMQQEPVAKPPRTKINKPE
jgi:hypothetical protein